MKDVTEHNTKVDQEMQHVEKNSTDKKVKNVGKNGELFAKQNGKIKVREGKWYRSTEIVYLLVEA